MSIQELEVPLNSRSCALEDPSLVEHERAYPDGYYPLESLAPPTEKELRKNLKSLDEKLIFVKGTDVSREEAREKYAHLHSWNKEKHSELVEILEPFLLALVERTVNFIITHPEEIKRRAQRVKMFQIPFRFSGLPPNLYDHLDPSRPFLPQTKEDVLELVNGFQVYNERLRGLNAWDEIRIGKESFYRDLGLELLRRQTMTSDLFTTPDEQEEWYNYNLLFRSQGRVRNTRPTFHQNTEFVNYLDNRQFSETSGFFDKTNSTFDAFFLADFHKSRSAFTSQIRVPFNYGREAPAAELLRSNYVFMELLKEDNEIEEKLKRLKAKHGGFLTTHLTRAHGLENIDPFFSGILGTMLESTGVCSLVFSTAEADGIPGFEQDLWGGIEAMLRSKVPKKAAATAAVASFSPSGLHGNRIKDMYINNDGRIDLEPKAIKKFREMNDRQIIAMYELWLSYHEELEAKKRDPSLPMPRAPRRFSLGCPFKGDVVQQVSEGLMTTRAAIHDPRDYTF